jgi:hypothetical protein
MKIQICFAVLQALSLARPHLVDVAAAAVQMEEVRLCAGSEHLCSQLIIGLWCLVSSTKEGRLKMGPH